MYRAIDQDGNLVDSRLSQKRDMDAAKRFFQQALQTVGHADVALLMRVRQFFRIRTAMTQSVSLQQQRELFRQRLAALQALVQAAS